MTRAGLGVDSRGSGTFTLMDRRGGQVTEPEAPAAAEPSQPADTDPTPGQPRPQTPPSGRRQSQARPQ
jgi:hypothetical protein